LLGAGALAWLACSSRAEPLPPESHQLAAPSSATSSRPTLAARDDVELAPPRSHDAPAALDEPAAAQSRHTANVGRETTQVPATEQASPSTSDGFGDLVVAMFHRRVQTLDLCMQHGQQGELSTAPVAFTVDLQIAPRGAVSALHVTDPPTGHKRAVDCASHLLRRLRFNPGPEEERAYRLRVVVGPNSRIESWSRKEKLLRVDDPVPTPLLGRPADAPSELERVLKERKVTGTAAEVLGY
jgi:hypothetical protein